jgi:hypothetical protein
MSRPIPAESGTAKDVIAWSSFFFALLQSICTFFAAVDGLRLVIGIGSLALSTWIGLEPRPISLGLDSSPNDGTGPSRGFIESGGSCAGSLSPQSPGFAVAPRSIEPA